MADLVLWNPAFFGAKPEIIIKGGYIAWAQMGEWMAQQFIQQLGSYLVSCHYNLSHCGSTAVSLFKCYCDVLSLYGSINASNTAE